MVRKKIIVSDIDGVLADSSARLLPHIESINQSRDYNHWLTHWIPYNTSPLIRHDLPIVEGIDLFHALRVGLRAEEFRFITARGCLGFDLTYEWLIEHVTNKKFPKEWLIMQPDPVEISPGIVWQEGMPRYNPIDQKRTEILQLKAKHDIVVAIDDRPDICQAYWHEGVHAMLVKFPEHDCQSLVKEEICMREEWK